MKGRVWGSWALLVVTWLLLLASLDGGLDTVGAVE